MATIVIPQNRMRQGSLNGNLVNNNRIDIVEIENNNFDVTQTDGYIDLFSTDTYSGANPTGSNYEDRNVYTNVNIEEYVVVDNVLLETVCYQICTFVGTHDYKFFVSNIEPAFRINAVKAGSDVVFNGEFAMYDDINAVKALIDVQTIGGGEQSIFFGGLKNKGISNDGYNFENTFTFVIAIPVYYRSMVGERSAFRITEWTAHIVTQGEKATLNAITTVYGSGTKSYTYTSNELIQNYTTIPVATVTTPISEYIADTILEKYEKGQQTISFTAIYGTYYDTSGNLIYNGIDGHTLKLGDIIEIRDIDNVSIALTPTGIAKTFRITSSEYDWNGNNDLYIECVQIV